MKQGHLAELIGVAQTTISRWEKGELRITDAQRDAIRRALALAPDEPQDAALKRLVESSESKVHLICDRTHRLIAASKARAAEWRIARETAIGRSLFAFASPRIRAAEQSLDVLGWREGRVSHLVIETDANLDRDIPIEPGLVRWERIELANGAARRLVTTIG
ncbi:helix-turn-helix transcriptional regulator [Terrarubrum flagellatum]|uniref:helix-turn-helix transcriptional regulator n=1 Tax=Terrirubrum flagellatum TaxID=2895980 RepID=UPI00314542B5